MRDLHRKPLNYGRPRKIGQTVMLHTIKFLRIYFQFAFYLDVLHISLDMLYNKHTSLMSLIGFG